MRAQSLIFCSGSSVLRHWPACWREPIRRYTMVPEFMAYPATIVKCAHDFEGISWAQYDRVYRRQVAQTDDLRWLRLNPTLYSLCFAGKAKRNIVCAYCLSDNRTTASCPDNTILFPWQGPPTRQPLNSRCNHP